MTAKLDPLRLDHAIELYLLGKPQAKILTTTGISATALHRERTSRGIPPRRTKVLDGAAVGAAYAQGESEYSIARRLNVSRHVVRRQLTALGVQIRSHSEAGLLRAAQMTPEQRAVQASQAHEATRGRVVPLTEKIRRAETNERRGHCASGTSDGERRMIRWLRERGEIPVPEKAVGPYNVDMAVHPVAVEVLGGGWHFYKRHHAVRTPYILDAGWHLVFVWNHEGRSALTPASADYVVAFAQEMRREPPAVSQYRVIAGNGEALSAGSREDNEFTLVPPPRGR